MGIPLHRFGDSLVLTLREGKTHRSPYGLGTILTGVPSSGADA
jgi:hypothetical protein